MQTFNVRYKSGVDFKNNIIPDVPYRKGFEMFGEKFVCHNNIKEGGHRDELRAVYHFKSGIAIAFARTYKEAKIKAENLLGFHCGNRAGFIALLNQYAEDEGIENININ